MVRLIRRVLRLALLLALFLPFAAAAIAVERSQR